MSKDSNFGEIGPSNGEEHFGHISPDEIDSISKRAEANLGGLEERLREMPVGSYENIRDFLLLMHIDGVKPDSVEEIEKLWKDLIKDPSLVRTLTFGLISKKSKLYFCDFPLLPDMDDLLDHSSQIKNPERLRQSVAEVAVNNLANLGFNRRQCVELAFNDAEELRPAAEATHFLGWIVGLPIMRGIDKDLEEHLERNGKEEAYLDDLATVVSIKILEAQDFIAERISMADEYDLKMDMEARDLIQKEAERALSALWRICDKILLGPPKSDIKLAIEGCSAYKSRHGA